MEGLVFDIRSFSIHDGPGLRTTVFLKGCLLRCNWCHNPESQSCLIEKTTVNQPLGPDNIQVEKNIGRKISVSEILSQLLADRPFFEESGGGLTISGGEPLFQPEFSKAILQHAKNCGIHTAIDTSGFAAKKVFADVTDAADLVLFDLKLANNDEHQYFTGQSNVQILKNLQSLSQSGKPYFIRIPLIPEITDTRDNLNALRNIVMNLAHLQRIDLLPFHPAARTKYERMNMIYTMKNSKAYNDEHLAQIKAFFAEVHSNVNIGG